MGFEAADDSKNIAKIIDCKDLWKGKSNTASHSNNTDKSEVSLIWTPPSDHKGKVTFVATVVGQNSGVSTWWENVKSKSLKI